MTDDHREIVRDAILDLSGFRVAAPEDVLNLLTSWARRDELTVMDIRDVLAYYRAAWAAPATEAAPMGVPPLPATLGERDPAPAGAVRGNDSDGDVWELLPTGRWQCSDGNGGSGMIRSVRRMVSVFGPVDWYNADGALIGVSHKGQR